MKLRAIKTSFGFLPLVITILILIGVIVGLNQIQHQLASQDSSPTPTITPTPTPTPPSIQVNYSATLGFLGDIMLARSIGDKITQGQNPFVHVQAKLDQYDARIGVIETTIADPSVAQRAAGKLYTFNAPLQSIEILKQANISVANTANNHTMDYGALALADMLTRLDNAGIPSVGSGQTIQQAFTPLLLDISLNPNIDTAPKLSARVAFIAFNDIENNFTNATQDRAGSAYYHQELLHQSIQSAQEQGADIIVAMPHWGIEYQTTPTARQKEIGHWLIDSGVDLVIGSHPHVVQSTENYQGKYIVYSLGNFIFDLMSGAEIGQVVELNISATATAIGNSLSTSPTIELQPPHSISTKINNLGFATIP